MRRMEEAEIASSLPRTPDDLGGPQGFEDFFRVEHVRLFRALTLLTGDEGEAEELMQQAFYKVWAKWDRVARMERPQGYLYRTAMNELRSLRRRARVAARRLLPEHERPDPLDQVEARELVLQALSRLSPRQRAALVLTEVMDHSVDEVGRILGITPSAVRTLVSRGRRALAAMGGPDDA